MEVDVLHNVELVIYYIIVKRLVRIIKKFVRDHGSSPGVALADLKIGSFIGILAS